MHFRQFTSNVSALLARSDWREPTDLEINPIFAYMSICMHLTQRVHLSSKSLCKQV